MQNRFWLQTWWRWIRWDSFIRKYLPLFLLLPVIISCYVPTQFLAELRIDANGDYALTYHGRLTWGPLYRDIKNGKLSPEDIKVKEDAVYQDLARDSAFKDIKSLGSGMFEVTYERSGRFIKPRSVSFPRRGIDILYLELRTNGHLYIAVAPRVGKAQKQDMEELGLLPNGSFRIITNALVVGQNAPAPPQPLKGYEGWQVYDWTITGHETAFPQMAIQFSQAQ